MPLPCASCGFTNEPEDRFCGGCGSPLAQPAPAPTDKRRSSEPQTDEAERRPLSILFADLVGSTEMSLQLDPEDLRDVIRNYQIACTAATKRYSGFVARYMGDGIMCYFGYPEAHEDDAERAIRAGIAIVDAIAALNADFGLEYGVELAVRVGIASGLVVVGDLIGEGVSRERAVVGDTPNLAARMQALATPNTVVIDPATHRRAGDRFVAHDLGPRRVKGVADAINVWRVLRPENPQSRFDLEMKAKLSPLVGRREELEELKNCWESASAGRGQVVLISGEAGIGKTRLARTAYSRIPEITAARLRYQCTPLFANSAFQPFIEQLENAAGFERSDTAGQKFAKVRGFLRQFSQDTHEFQGLLARLLSVPAPAGFDTLNLGAHERKQRTIEALSGQILSLANRAGMLALFEDLHWADPSSLELLDALVTEARDAPLLILCTARDGYNPGWLAQPHVSHIRLDRLSAGEMGQMLERMLAGQADPVRLKDQILAKTDGIPLFVEELTRSLIGAHDAASASGDADSENNIPDTLQSFLMARLDRLRLAKGIAQTGAAIGRRFDYDLLDSVSPMANDGLDAALLTLVDDGMVNCQGRPPDAAYAFHHGLMRDVAYQSMLRRKRREIHAKIAAALEHDFKTYWESKPEILAHHLTEANDPDKAIDYWASAARKAMEGAANIEAERHFRRAIELLATLDPSLERDKRELNLLASLGAVLINNHGPGSPVVEATYRRCRDLCEQIGAGGIDGASTEHFATLWGLWRTCDSLSVAMELVEQMRALGETAARSDLVMQAHHSGWATLFNLGRLQDCLTAIDTGEPLYDPDAHRDHASLYGGHDPKVCAHGIGGVALCLRGLPEQGAARIEQGVALARTLNQPGSLAHALDFATTFHRMCENPEQTLSMARLLIDCAGRQEFADYATRARGFRGWALARCGELDTGLKEIRASMIVQRETGMSEDFPLFLEMLAEIHGLIGDPEHGLIAIDEAWREALKNEAAFWSPAIKRRQAALLMQRNSSDRGRAIECLHQGLAIAVEQGATLHELNLCLDLARLEAGGGDYRGAIGRLRNVYAGISEGFDFPVVLKVEAYLASATA